MKKWGNIFILIFRRLNQIVLNLAAISEQKLARSYAQFVLETENYGPIFADFQLQKRGGLGLQHFPI